MVLRAALLALPGKIRRLIFLDEVNSLAGRMQVRAFADLLSVRPGLVKEFLRLPTFTVLFKRLAGLRLRLLAQVLAV